MQRWLAAAAVYRDPRILAILALGFSSGLPFALTGATLQAWLTEEGLSLGTIGLFASVGTPYALKFLWAPLIDKLPLPGFTRALGRRRGWMLATQLALIAATLALGFSDPRAAPLATAALAFLVAFASASQDVVIDAFRVEVLEERQLGAGAAAIVFGYRIGMLVSGAGALYLASAFSWALVYAVMTAGLLVGVATVLLSPEPSPRMRADADAREAAARGWLNERPHFNPRLGAALAWVYVAVIGPFVEFMGRRGWLAVLLFAMLFKFGDSLAGQLQTTFFLNLGFTKIDVANVAKVYGFAATMAGMFVGGWLMKAVGLVRALWISGILQMLSNLMFALQAAAGADLTLLALTVGAEQLTGGMGTAALVAYFSSLCNVSYTATQYALLSSFTAVTTKWLSSSAGYLVEMMGWVDFFLLTTIAALPGLALLWWLGRLFTPAAAARTV